MKIDLREKIINTPPTVVNKKWKVRADHCSQASYTSMKATTREDWYFDNGCSRHMTDNNSYLSNVKSCMKNHVTFGNGAKRNVTNKCQLDVTGFPALHNVLLVKGVTANLISTSQFCDQGIVVKFLRMVVLLLSMTPRS